MVRFSLVMTLGVVILSGCDAIRFSKCGLVRALRRHTFPEKDLRNWVCLVEHESSRNTAALGPITPEGYRAYGLFQIYSKLWCTTTSVPGKGCNVRCADLLSDNITKASACAKKIYHLQGFHAWVGWVKHCQEPNSLPDISKC